MTLKFFTTGDHQLDIEEEIFDATSVLKYVNKFTKAKVSNLAHKYVFFPDTKEEIEIIRLR